MGGLSAGFVAETSGAGARTVYKTDPGAASVVSPSEGGLNKNNKK